MLTHDNNALRRTAAAYPLRTIYIVYYNKTADGLQVPNHTNVLNYMPLRIQMFSPKPRDEKFSEVCGILNVSFFTLSLDESNALDYNSKNILV